MYGYYGFIEFVKKLCKYSEIEKKKKIELAVTKNFSWQFVKISIIRGVLKVTLMILRTLES
jgi:hypothetical protein